MDLESNLNETEVRILSAARRFKIKKLCVESGYDRSSLEYQKACGHVYYDNPEA